MRYSPDPWKEREGEEIRVCGGWEGAKRRGPRWPAAGPAMRLGAAKTAPTGQLDFHDSLKFIPPQRNFAAGRSLKQAIVYILWLCRDITVNKCG